MYTLKNNMFFRDLSSEVKNESKYISKFFLFFMLSYFLIYITLNMVVSYISGLNITEKTANIIRMSLSELMMLLVFLMTKLFTRKMQSVKHPVMDCMTGLKFFKILIASVFVLAVGSMTSAYVIGIISAITGKMPHNLVEQTVSDMSILEIFIFVVVLAPIFEELFFRKLMIDTFSKYGTAFSVVVSAFVFGFIHGNLYQFFYAFGLGILMGYVYCIYGNVLYTIFIHAIINTLGSIVPIVIGVSETSNTVSPNQAAYTFVYMGLAVFGGIILFKNLKKLKFFNVGGVLISPSKALYKSCGFIIWIVLFAIDFVYNTIFI